MRGRSALAVLAWPILSCGCYAYSAQVMDHPVPATIVEVTLNDRGRVAMQDHVGAEVLTVEGSVTSADDSSFVLQMKKATTINRQVSRWQNELVTFRTEYVRQVRERRFSMGRTALLGGLATAGAVAFATTPLAGRLLGIGGGPTGGDNGTPSH